MVWVVVVLAIAIWAVNQTSVVKIQPSGVLGLASLNQLAKTSIPYEVAIANGKPSLIEFYANWCTTCQAMAPMLESLHQDYGSNLNFVMIDIDDPQWQQPIQQYGVKGVPQITLLTAEQKVVHSSVGKLPKPVLIELLQQMDT